MSTLTVSAVARQLSDETGVTVSPSVISTFFYKRYLDDRKCPVVNGVRLIPEDYVPAIEGELRDRGVIPSDEANA